MSLLDSLGKKLEPIMLFMGLVSPIATLPQLYKLYITHSHHAHGLSLTTWSMYALISLLWFIYGLYHRNPTIWVGNLLGFLAYLAMVVGIIIKAGIAI
ncbi:hypothetical protein BS333_07155 [Vibrio azureus]|uniref:Sugar transporter SemiSWEET n=1 Tax=Vibrio azureus NBRC 104587 TaxID=1219077 RepID=U3A9X9_9VIBR|nr:SemiSWEET transporter [Vibrio azureus]AUI86183.1 hypothetical protein BS333_07155 [Vibrio azureus]GAD76731.1 hypothetical protein VAZ01S_050_00430 [Vibrio azureus NBRC 104587]